MFDVHDIRKQPALALGLNCMYISKMIRNNSVGDWLHMDRICPVCCVSKESTNMNAFCFVQGHLLIVTLEVFVQLHLVSNN